MINRIALNRTVNTEKIIIDRVWKEDISYVLERLYRDKLAASFVFAESIEDAIEKELSYDKS